MNPALINLGYRKRLDNSVLKDNNPFKRIYENSCSEFNISMHILKSQFPGINDYNKIINQNYKQRIIQEINHSIIEIKLNTDYIIIFDITEKHPIVFPFNNLENYNIINGTIDPLNLIIDLYFKSEELTLLDSIGDKILVTKGNKSEAFNKKQEITDSFFIQLNEDYYFSKYKLI